MLIFQILSPFALPIDFLLVEAIESRIRASLFLFDRHILATLSLGGLFFYVLDFFLFFDF